MSERHNHEIRRSQENILGIYESILSGGKNSKKSNNNDLKYDGKAIQSSVNKMLNKFGKIKDGLIIFESKNYIFTKKKDDVSGESISVNNKNGELIFQNKQFTNKASQKDVNAMNMLQDTVKEYEGEILSEQQAQSQGLKIAR